MSDLEFETVLLLCKTLSQGHISGIGLDPRIILESCPQRFTMSKKRDHSHCVELHSCSAKFVDPISFVSLLICVTAMVRVELISQRVHRVENIVAEVKQTPLKSKGKEASSIPFNDFDQVALEAERIMTGEVDRNLLHSSLIISYLYSRCTDL